jgi:hypothetical protein
VALLKSQKGECELCLRVKQESVVDLLKNYTVMAALLNRSVVSLL